MQVGRELKNGIFLFKVLQEQHRSIQGLGFLSELQYDCSLKNSNSVTYVCKIIFQNRNACLVDEKYMN